VGGGVTSDIVIRLRDLLGAVVAARESLGDSYFVETVLEGIEVDLLAIIEHLEAGHVESREQLERLEAVLERLQAVEDENAALQLELDSALRSLRERQVADSGGGA
jgi:hypothetical protein